MGHKLINKPPLGLKNCEIYSLKFLFYINFSKIIYHLISSNLLQIVCANHH